MKMLDDLSPEQVRELFHYNPLTGVFVRRGGMHAKRWAGRPAGFVHKVHGYVVIKVGLAAYLAHRLAWLYVHGHWPDRLIDHKNGVRADNRIDNLRLANDVQNTWNRKMHATNSAGAKGVVKRKSRWLANIQIDGRQVYLGSFMTKEEAAKAYQDAASRHFGEFVRDDNTSATPQR